MDIHAFIDKWANCAGGAERGNAALYLVEMLTALDLPTPDPASADTAQNDYVFERAVRSGFDGALPRRIDLYKRGCFVLEAKQSRWGDKVKAAPFDPSEIAADIDDRAPFGPGSGLDKIRRNAFNQAKSYVGDLPVDHPSPPFIIVCDVARSFEVWADFSGTGRGFAPFPNRRQARFLHADLAKPEVQQRIRAIWTQPQSLDPTQYAVSVTRDIVDELAVVSRRLETQGHEPEQVAQFLMRCIFTIFAADVGLLPKARLITLLEDCVRSPRIFVQMFEDLWKRLNAPDYAERYFYGFGAHVPYINGNLFETHKALPLEAPELNRLLRATRHDWRHVEPSIFGSLLEQALRPAERRRLGAHYTPRRHVERLVDLTVMEPLRADWRKVSTQIEQACDEHDTRGAVRLARAFHESLRRIRILDPACGTGNFLYVALELLKRLEAEVLETLIDLGEPDQLSLGIIEPGQFLGLEVNPRAAAISKLVLWIGWLQQHYRNHAAHPAEPILRAHGNIQWKDAVLSWTGAPIPQFRATATGAVPDWRDLSRPDWPQADFIIGNPPFIGGKDLRSRLDAGYAEALWAAHPQMNDSADLVMYWWDRAAEILTTPGTSLRRFGFVTTNSITQVFQRRTIERWIHGPRPLSLVHAIPDHPWTKASRDSAAVRIAMTVAEAGRHDGELATVIAEADLETDAPVLVLTSARGRINADLSLGVDATRARALRANTGLCSPGVKLHGSGFIISHAEAIRLGLGRQPGLEAHIRPYRNGRDLTGRSRDAWVIDLFGLEREEVRDRFPEVYAYLAETVRDARLAQLGTSPTADARAYADQWWVFGKARPDLRSALSGLPRYIATVETAKHRVFQFLDAAILPDNMLVCVADDDAATLAVLSSRAQAVWCRARGGLLEDRPRYTKTGCFDPFPFPTTDATSRAALRAAGEALNAHRQRVLEDHPDLTLTGLYNLLDITRTGGSMPQRQQDIARRARIVILRELHDEIDRLTADAYGWQPDQTGAQLLGALVGLNRVREVEEARGQVRWLRPDFQIDRVGAPQPSPEREAPLMPQVVKTGRRPVFPRDRYEQPLAIQASLVRERGPVKPLDLALRFSGGVKLEPRISRVLTTLHRYGHVELLDDGRWISARH
ncbi:class I SAM-dependent DNA methyltransferase [Brevundimonas sp.]